MIRHGQTVSNASGRWQGHGNSDLDELGRKQARRLGVRLRDVAFDRIECSDLSRAHDTAKAVCELSDHELSPTPVTRWREIDVGAWEGKTRQEVAELYPGEIAGLAKGEDVKIGGAESWLDLGRRIDSAVQQWLSDASEDEHGLVVAHGGVVSSLATWVTETRGQRPNVVGRIVNTAITTLCFPNGQNEQAKFVRFNDAAHAGYVSGWVKERMKAGNAAIACVPTERDMTIDLEEILIGVEDVYVWGQLSSDAVDFRHERVHRIEPTDVRGWTAALHQKHPNHRIALVAPAEVIRDAGDQLVGKAVFATPAGVSHIIVSSKMASIADWSTGARFEK